MRGVADGVGAGHYRHFFVEVESVLLLVRQDLPEKRF